MSESWNDPQLRGRLNTGNGEIDFGSVIPSALNHAEVADLTALIAPRRVLLCQARDSKEAELETPASRFQQLVGATHESWLRIAPNQPLDDQLLIEWLEQKYSR